VNCVELEPRSYGEVIRRRMSSELMRRSRLKSEPRGSKGKRPIQDQEQERLKSEPRKGKRPIQDQEQERLKSEPQVWRGKPNLLKSSLDDLVNIYKMFEDDDKPFMCMLGGILYKNKAWEKKNGASSYHKSVRIYLYICIIYVKFVFNFIVSYF
jgi:hypothetical protein